MIDSAPRILVLTLGGTIDAQVYPLEEYAYPAQAIPACNNAAFSALQSLFPKIEYVQNQICEKDSKDLSEDDLRSLTDNIMKAKDFERIIVTMGTDRMRETALDIKSRMTAPPCPVIFTGAIWPLSNGEDISDGYENLTLAVNGKPNADDKIYIAMSGHFAPPEKLIKNFNAKRFDLSS